MRMWFVRWDAARHCLVILPVPQSICRADARSAALRNRYILDHADSLFLGALDPSGSPKGLMSLPPHLYKCGGSGEPYCGVVVDKKTEG